MKFLVKILNSLNTSLFAILLIYQIKFKIDWQPEAFSCSLSQYKMYQFAYSAISFYIYPEAICCQFIRLTERLEENVNYFRKHCWGK